MERYIRSNGDRGISFVSISVITYVAYLLVPIITAYIPQLFRYIIYLFILSGTVYSLFASKSKAEGLLTLFAITIFLLLVYLGEWKQRETVYSFFLSRFLFWAGLLFVTGLKDIEERETLIIGKTFLILVIITMITTLVGNILHPNASRELALSITEIEYIRQNIGGYGFVYGIVVFFPYTIYMLKTRSRKHKIVPLIMVVLSFLLCIFTEYSLAIIITTTIFMIEILRSIRKRSLLLLVLLFFIAVFLIRKNIEDVLIVLQEKSLDSNLISVAERIQSIRELFFGSTYSGNVLLRRDKYYMSIDIFLENPIIGNLGADNKLGGHSEILDILAASGLIGFSFFCLLVSLHINNILEYRNSDYFWPCLESLLAFIAVASINTVLSSAVIGSFVFLCPVMMKPLIYAPPTKTAPTLNSKYIK